MDTFECRVAHQGLLLRVTGVTEGKGAQKRDGITHNQCHHQQFEYRLSQVDLNAWKKKVS